MTDVVAIGRGVDQNVINVCNHVAPNQVLENIVYECLKHSSGHSRNSPDPFADDTTVVGLISKNDESAYREEVVYVARNAKDNVVSYFHFDRMEKVQPEPGDWNSFLERFKDGKMVFGSWYDHVCGWWEKKQTFSKIHYMFYEDLVEDTGRELENLCSFLGLSPSEEERKEIVRCVQFDVMKANPMTNQMDDPTLDFSVSQFLRKVFQNFMNEIFQDMLHRFVIVYIDDILIYSSNLSDHTDHVQQVLNQLHHYHLYLKLEKCEFHQPTIQFFGCVISPEGIQMDRTKVEAVKNWPQPHTIKGLQHFLGFVYFYCRFISGYSELTAPLTSLLGKKPKSLRWTSDAMETFR
ncbi:hypothetical protein QTP70_013418 [Hemibagrus guttatus]|uniref:Sulfotransferase n=1 Tax=Hemibagrus guttatus TaxID=175788 RepID=A0AAE0R162_9TELE|nr:hypothetical protein QTP70_013418 [Hemibagrus guttatus]